MRASTSILSLGLALFSAQARAGPQVSTPPFGGPPSGGPPFGGPPFGQPGQNPGHVAKALYLISNQSPNSVIALPVDENGLVSAGTETPTGGNGGAFLQADGVTPVPVDALNSQDPVVRSGDVSNAKDTQQIPANMTCSIFMWSTSARARFRPSPLTRKTR